MPSSLLSWLAIAGALIGCAGTVDSSPPSAADAAPPPEAAPSQAVDVSATVAGVPDNGMDTAVVAIAGGPISTCSGVVIGSNVVLTAKSCVTTVSVPLTCPATGAQVVGYVEPDSLSIVVGDDLASASVAAGGLEIVAPDSAVLCDEDIAAIITDSDLAISPIKRDTTLPIVGQPVRTVGFDETGTKILREYVPILAMSPTELEIAEATCAGSVGGPALEEPDGTLIGVVSRSGSSCTGEDVHNVYTRADAYAEFIASALEEGLTQGGSAIKAAGKPPTEVGAPCTEATDCSTGVCVEDSSAPYCTYACGTHARCQTGFSCTAAVGAKYCFEK
jgi:Trypsin